MADSDGPSRTATNGCIICGKVVCLTRDSRSPYDVSALDPALQAVIRRNAMHLPSTSIGKNCLRTQKRIAANCAEAASTHLHIMSPQLFVFVAITWNAAMSTAAVNNTVNRVWINPSPHNDFIVRLASFNAICVFGRNHSLLSNCMQSILSPDLVE